MKILPRCEQDWRQVAAANGNHQSNRRGGDTELEKFHDRYSPHAPDQRI